MHNNKMKGAVSLFIVIFSTLLIVVVTVGFTRIMIAGQQQATDTDLSQSAYDSSLAGVEDVKRALLRYQTICSSGNVVECANAKAELDSPVCNAAVKTLTEYSGVADGGEITVQTNGNDSTLNQAYTCVKIAMDTIDYEGSLVADESNIVPLVGVGAFNAIQVQWFSKIDMSTHDSNYTVDLSNSSSPSLFAQTSWADNRPAILRAQLVQFSGDSGFKLSDFNLASNASTLFLYPSSMGLNITSFSNDVRMTATGAPKLIKCDSSLLTKFYACTTTISLPAPVNGGSRAAYLRLSALYNGTSYRVALYNDSTLVKFDGVQPEIDSTGRANDVFRRVKARVEMSNTNFPYPDAAVDISGNLCKDFVVTDNSDDYASNCTP